MPRVVIGTKERHRTLGPKLVEVCGLARIGGCVSPGEMGEITDYAADASRLSLRGVKKSARWALAQMPSTLGAEVGPRASRPHTDCLSCEVASGTPADRAGFGTFGAKEDGIGP